MDKIDQQNEITTQWRRIRVHLTGCQWQSYEKLEGFDQTWAENTLYDLFEELFNMEGRPDD